MSSLSSRIPLSKPKKAKESLRAKIKRRKRHAQITVLQSLASSASAKKPSEAELFQHTHQMGESHGAPHSIANQIQQGKQTAHVISHDSYKEATDHSRDQTFKHLSTNFGLS